MQIVVKYQDDLSKDVKDIRLEDVLPTDTVADLKAAIFIKEGVPAAQQALLFAGKELSDYAPDGEDKKEETVAELGFVENCIVNMTMCEEKKEGKRQLSREYYDDRDTEEGASKCVVS
ncbi:hypothetical protein TrLO_g11201 [Triparma laevis f. longispina]|uniref:Ubiquitin-like domain-containing protein n=1 Tax=Triparma laevis f. longispina TaxID=1714387 RepID=A0A9W7CF11_9STRA|nr:hypothetical protein TrLO_g11201 [Triparma laevis f. longispina]